MVRHISGFDSVGANYKVSVVVGSATDKRSQGATCCTKVAGPCFQRGRWLTFLIAIQREPLVRCCVTRLIRVQV